jgi:hypothetical protein
MVYGRASSKSAGRSFSQKESLIGSSTSSGPRPNPHQHFGRHPFSVDASQRLHLNPIDAAPHAVWSAILASIPSKSLIGTLCSPQ